MEKSSNQSHEFQICINNLDNYSLWEIFSYLSLQDLLNVEKVCVRWKDLSQKCWEQVKTFQCTGNDCETKRILNPYYNNCLFLDKNFKRTFHSSERNAKKLKNVLQRCGHFITNHDLQLIDKFEKTNIVNFGTGLIAFELIPQFCKNIKFVNIEFLSPILSGISIMAKNWTKLVSLRLQVLTIDMEKSLNLFLKNNNELKYLSLKYVDDYNPPTYDFLKYLQPDVIEEIEVNMNHLGIFISDTFISLSKNFKCLRSLSLEGSNYLFDEMAEAIGNIETLTALSLARTKEYQTDKTLNYIAKLVNLRKLNLSFTEILDQNLICILKSCRELVILNISGCKLITDEGLVDVGELQKLRTLLIHSVDGVSRTCINNLHRTIQVRAYYD